MILISDSVGDHNKLNFSAWRVGVSSGKGRMADLSKLPWLAPSGSRFDIDAISSTTLHSIYGSQVSLYQ